MARRLRQRSDAISYRCHELQNTNLQCFFNCGADIVVVMMSAIASLVDSDLVYGIGYIVFYSFVFAFIPVFIVFVVMAAFDALYGENSATRRSMRRISTVAMTGALIANVVCLILIRSIAGP